MKEGFFSIGIDIGGTNTVVGVVNAAGDIVKEYPLKTHQYDDPAPFVAAIGNWLIPVIEEIGRDKIVGVGVGAPNANYYSGNIELAANLPWKGVVPLKQMLESTLHLPVVITNDANAAAIGEGAYGAAKGKDDFLIVTLGTGVGSGFVTNGKLLYGHDGFAGELGHVTVIRNGRDCGCGRKGCLETYASAKGIVTTAIEFLQNEDNSKRPGVLRAIWEKNGKLSAKDIHQAAQEGDELAIGIFNYTGRILGQVLANTVLITSPEIIVFFGGLALSGDYLIRPTKATMEENLLEVFKNKIEIVPSALLDKNAAILGAAALAYH